MEAARAVSAMQRLEAVEMLANNVDLRQENADAFTRACAREVAEDRPGATQLKPGEPTADANVRRR